MASAEPIKMRIREGCRGGQEQFRWNQVKDQDFKDREQYLGQTSRVGTMGKFGRYYVHDWYQKKRETATNIKDERESVQNYEEALMQEALGLRPKKLLLSKGQLSPEELAEFLKTEKSEGKRGRDQMGPQAKVVTNEQGIEVEEDFVGNAHRDAPIKGIGFASHRTAKLEEIKAQAFGTEAKLEGTSAASLLKAEQIKREYGIKVESEVKEEARSSGATGSGAKPAGEVEEFIASVAFIGAKPGMSFKLGAAGQGYYRDGPAADGKEASGGSPKKRKHEGDGEGGEGGEKPKKEKKDKKEKKLKKAEKKLKKKEKKAKKQIKKADKMALKAKKEARAAYRSGSSSSSSS